MIYSITTKFNKCFLSVVTSILIVYVTIAKLTREYKPVVYEEFIYNSTTYYILIWTNKTCENCAPLNELQLGYIPFEKCNYKNCYLSTNNKFTNNNRYVNFDAIIFHGRVLSEVAVKFPEVRFSDQKYIFFDLEAPNRFPLCDEKFDDFFNWTITYRLDSDVPCPYIRVKNVFNQIVGPKIQMQWPSRMTPVDDNLKKVLKGKTKMAAWFVSNCYAHNQRLHFVKQLNREMTRLNQSTCTVDVYGECGIFTCPRGDYKKCNKMLEKDYLFYLALENSFDIDYVTEKVLTALQNNVVPVVYGYADYSRFLPPWSYLDARILGPKRLAEVMLHFYHNRTQYHMFFEWKNHFYYEDTRGTGFVCQLCELMNKKYNETSYREFRKWWHKDFQSLCNESEFYTSSEYF